MFSQLIFKAFVKAERGLCIYFCTCITLAVIITHVSIHYALLLAPGHHFPYYWSWTRVFPVLGQLLLLCRWLSCTNAPKTKLCWVITCVMYSTASVPRKLRIEKECHCRVSAKITVWMKKSLKLSSCIKWIDASECKRREKRVSEREREREGEREKERKKENEWKRKKRQVASCSVCVFGFALHHRWVNGTRKKRWAMTNQSHTERKSGWGRVQCLVTLYCLRIGYYCWSKINWPLLAFGLQVLSSNSAGASANLH